MHTAVLATFKMELSTFSRSLLLPLGIESSLEVELASLLQPWQPNPERSSVLPWWCPASALILVESGWLISLRSHPGPLIHFCFMCLTSTLKRSAPVLYGTPPQFAQKRKILWENLKARSLLFLGSSDVATSASHFHGLLVHSLFLL